MPATLRPRALRRDAQANRARIVTAARSAFSEHGLDAPVEEIARRAGVGMGTVYRHFPAKEDLVDAVFEESLEQVLGAARDALAAPDAWIGFCTFLERAFELHMGNRGLKDVVLTSAPGRARAESARTRLRPLVRRLVARAQEQGTLRPDFSATDVPPIFWALGRVIEGTAGIAPNVWRRQLGFVLDGLRTSAATPLAHPPLSPAQLERASGRRHA